MSAATTTPTIPPRPVRSQNKPPEIPPRPLPKRLESPSRSHYPPSPFNEPIGRLRSNDTSDTNLPPRPPSVTLPSIGQEGSEYADINYEDADSLNETTSQASEQTRHIGGNLPMHAPKPSLPLSTAKAQVQAVTRTDSSQAAAHGIGKAPTPVHDELEPLTRLKSKSSFSRPGSSASSVHRRPSISHDEDHGPAELGMRVPINPYVGDVQAPSPAPVAENFHGHNLSGGHRKHHRTRSGRDVFGPPDSYGLHGHGLVSTDKFEKDWYAKHPDILQREKEKGLYHAIGSGRGESALSSEELNRLVRETTNRSTGFGASPSVPAYPDEQIGYLASEQYSSRVASPATAGGLYKLETNHSQPAIASPLRKTSFPAEFAEEGTYRLSRPVTGSSERVIDSENEDDVVHVADPAHKYNKITGGQETVNETENFGPTGGDHSEAGGYVDDNGYGIPILASDEVAKEVGGEYMQPAVPAHPERLGSAFEEYGSGAQTPRSRPSSRPGSMHGASGASRFIFVHEDPERLHTPLEDVEEYEPLFPEDDGPKKPLTAADRFKQRPDSLKHRFPSQDIWEDAPTSQLHQATVSTPDLVGEDRLLPHTSAFETPEQEGARKGEPSEAEKAKLIPKEERLAKSKFAPHLRDDMPTRPGMQNRFPSQDIWEDSPDSVHLVTTVSTPPAQDVTSPQEAKAKPTIPARPVNRTKLGENEPSVPLAQPHVPARPPKRLHQVSSSDAQVSPMEKHISPTETKKPVVPDRPKPQIPSRPRKDSGDSLTKTISGTSAGSAGSEDSTSTAKAKPAVPARPVGSKIANLRAGFMSDLDKRLQLGRQPPPSKEPEPTPDKEVDLDKGTLTDARKGRARGPQRRKPATTSSTEVEQSPAPSFKVFAPQSLWHISNEDDLLTVYGHGDTQVDTPSSRQEERNITGPTVKETKAVKALEQGSSDAVPNFASPLSTNTAGDYTDPGAIDPADATPEFEKTDPFSKSPATLAKSVGAGSDEIGSSSLTGTRESDHLPQQQKSHVEDEDEDQHTTLEKGKNDSGAPIPKSLSEQDLEAMTAKADGKDHAPEEGNLAARDAA